MSPKKREKKGVPAPTDERIIDVLYKDADVTYKEIARNLGLNESTVRKRILALRKSGVIRKFMVEIDTETLGNKMLVELGVDVDPPKLIEVGRKLVAIPEAEMVFNTAGGHDFWAVVWTKDRESLAEVVNRVALINGVTKVIPCIVVERLK